MSDSRMNIWDGLMDIYAPSGTEVIFRGKGGYPIDLDNALKAGLKAGETYKVHTTEVHSSCTYVILQGFLGKKFNTCMFGML